MQAYITLIFSFKKRIIFCLFSSIVFDDVVFCLLFMWQSYETTESFEIGQFLAILSKPFYADLKNTCLLSSQGFGLGWVCFFVINEKAISASNETTTQLFDTILLILLFPDSFANSFRKKKFLIGEIIFRWWGLFQFSHFSYLLWFESWNIATWSARIMAPLKEVLVTVILKEL